MAYANRNRIRTSRVHSISLIRINTPMKTPLTNDETRDITIRIIDHLIEKLQWEPKLEEGDVGEWYPFELQDEIHTIINKALEVKE